MRKICPPQSVPSRRLLSPVRLAVALVAVLAAAPLFCTQEPAQKSTATSTHKAVHAHKKSSKTAAKTQSAVPAQVATSPAPVTPPEPERPDWPVNNQPVAATVTWDSHGLRIVAANSSLRQILDDISEATGTVIQGLGTDKRIYGTLGPGTAREVISQLLQGSEYNILMVGDQGQGTPRQIMLTPRNATASSKTASKETAKTNDDDDSEADEPVQTPTPAPAPVQNNSGPANPRMPPQAMGQQQPGQQSGQQQQPGQPQQTDQQ
jgi:hypothetical protein